MLYDVIVLICVIIHLIPCHNEHPCTIIPGTCHGYKKFQRFCTRGCSSNGCHSSDKIIMNVNFNAI